jgi:hypothetical protein
VVLPVCTSPCPLTRRMAALRFDTSPGGGGHLLIDEPYLTLLDPRTLLLVEVVDFGCAGVSGRGPAGSGGGGRFGAGAAFGEGSSSSSEGGGDGLFGVRGGSGRGGSGGRVTTDGGGGKRMRQNGGMVGVAWGFVRPVGRVGGQRLECGEAA